MKHKVFSGIHETRKKLPSELQYVSDVTAACAGGSVSLFLINRSVPDVAGTCCADQPTENHARLTFTAQWTPSDNTVLHQCQLTPRANLRSPCTVLSPAACARDVVSVAVAGQCVKLEWVCRSRRRRSGAPETAMRRAASS